MTGLAVEISSKPISKSSSPSARAMSTKQAWAKYVRNRFLGQNLVKAAQIEWGLTEGQARGLVYGQASQSTIDAVQDHPNGGFMLALDLLLIRWRTSLEEVARSLEEESRRERDRAQARIEREGRALRRLASRDDLLPNATVDRRSGEDRRPSDRP